MIILAIQSTYLSIEIGVYKKDVTIPIAYDVVSKTETATLLTHITKALGNSSLRIEDLTACIVNQGPAPFTTLRTVIATANGIGASLKIPIIGANGLEAFATEYNLDNKDSIILLNAFANDFYFYTNTFENGICSLDQIKKLIEQHHISNIIGNGGPVIQQTLDNTNNCYKFIDTEKGACSLNTLVDYAMGQANFSLQKQFLKQNYVSPLYFKEINIF